APATVAEIFPWRGIGRGLGASGAVRIARSRRKANPWQRGARRPASVTEGSERSRQPDGPGGERQERPEGQRALAPDPPAHKREDAGRGQRQSGGEENHLRQRGEAEPGT